MAQPPQIRASPEVALRIGRDIRDKIVRKLPPGWSYVFILAPTGEQGGRAINHVWCQGEPDLASFLGALAERIGDDAGGEDDGN